MSQVWTWRHAIWESDLAATTKLVLQALASHLNDMGGPMFPSQERLAKLCSLSERAVITHLDVAEEKGWIVARKRELNGSRWAANEYVARFPDGVKDVHPTKADGVKDVHPGGEGRSPGGVKDVQTNIPSESSTEPSKDQDGVWLVDNDFMEVVRAYTRISPARVKLLEAWSVWVAQGLAKDASLILRALPHYAKLDQWTKEDRRYVPSLHKWLGDGGWRQVAEGMPSPEELKEQAQTSKAGMAAYHRVQTDKMRGVVSSPADLKAVSKWLEQQARLNQKINESVE